MVRPRCEGMQSDSPMAEISSQMYEPKVEEWMREKREEGMGIEAEDPIAEK